MTMSLYIYSSQKVCLYALLKYTAQYPDSKKESFLQCIANGLGKTSMALKEYYSNQ